MRVWNRGRWMRPLWLLGCAVVGFAAAIDAMAVAASFIVDLNGDGAVNAVDVQLVINAALGVGTKG